MGLLCDRGGKGGAADIEAVTGLALGVAEVWNRFGGKDNGFEVFVGEKNVRECCELGHRVLIESRRFPNPPGPFKRVATLVVLARLFPFFQFKPEQPSGTQQVWISRIVALLVPATLSVLEVNVSRSKNTEKWEPLGNWQGFASSHYKIEFLAFLQWLDNLEWISPVTADQEKWNLAKTDRLARMVLATSLIIEANYYCTENGGPKPNNLRGKCRGCIDRIDLTPLTYDERLYDNAVKAEYPLD